MPAPSADPCEIHEMSWCGICSGADKETKPRKTGATIAASYAGRCAHCGASYDEGDRITHSTDADGWVIESHTDSGF